jgi:DNA-binding transcriptional ArsR family regulator
LIWLVNPKSAIFVGNILHMAAFINLSAGLSTIYLELKELLYVYPANPFINPLTIKTPSKMAYFTKDELQILAKAKATIRAASHPLRHRMLVLIMEHGNRIHVTPMYKKLRIEQSVCSQQLGILRKARLVTAKKEGKVVYYSVNTENIKHLLKTCEKMVGVDAAPAPAGAIG